LPQRADAVLSYWYVCSCSWGLGTCTRRNVQTQLLFGPAARRLGPSYAQPQPDTAWAAEEQSKLWFKGGPDVDQVCSSSTTAAAGRWSPGYCSQQITPCFGKALLAA
jgi:hypothetical protein